MPDRHVLRRSVRGLALATIAAASLAACGSSSHSASHAPASTSSSTPPAGTKTGRASGTTAGSGPARRHTAPRASTPTPAPANHHHGATGPAKPSKAPAKPAPAKPVPVTGNASAWTLERKAAKTIGRQDDLKDVKVSCPRGGAYPVVCKLTAVEVAHGKRTPVVGKATVSGYNTATHSYDVESLYAPRK